MKKQPVSVTHSALISDVAQAHHTIASFRGIDAAPYHCVVTLIVMVMNLVCRHSGRFNTEFGTMVEKQVGYHRGTVKAPAEGVEETAQRFKALEWTRAAGTAWGCGSVVHDLILGYK